LIDHDGRPVPFQPDPWQEADFAALDPAWMQIAGFPVPDNPIRRAWLERPRGHSKTSDLAIACAWVLCHADHPVKGVSVAADKEQSGILRDAVGTLARLNPQIGELLTIENWRVRNKATGSELQIISSDAGSSYGILPDFLVADELSIWGEGGGEELWHSLISAAAKRSHCVLVAIMNAGFQDSWVWEVREKIAGDPAWHFAHLEGPKASWISPSRLDEQRTILPPLVYDRLWNNVWSSGSGDAIQEVDIQASIIRPGPISGPEEGWAYFGGVDLGVSRDLAALVLLGKHINTGRLRLARCVAWQAPKGGKIDLAIVATAAWELHLQFHPKFLIDPYQAEMLAQQLNRRGAHLETVPFAGQTLVEMASTLVEAFSSRRIEVYPDAGLLTDLRRLRIVEGPSGWKLQAPRTASGHCDRATALSLAILGARRARLMPQAAMPMILSPGRLDSFRDPEWYGHGQPPAPFIDAGQRTGPVPDSWLPAPTHYGDPWWG
jgi:phage terminase large subunit-like protein